MSFKFYQNYEVAFNKLNQFAKQELKDDLDKAGLIQGFEFTFEQCWKAIQKRPALRYQSRKPKNGIYLGDGKRLDCSY